MRSRPSARRRPLPRTGRSLHRRLGWPLVTIVVGLGVLAAAAPSASHFDTRPLHPIVWSQREGAGGRWHVKVIDSIGGEARDLPTGALLDARDPAVSPDGEWIAFTGVQDDPAGEIYVVRRNGAQLARVTHHAGADRYPSWLPDGSGLVFTSEIFAATDSARFAIAELDLRTRRQRLLTPGHPGDLDFFAPSTAPDGRTIVTTAWRAGREESLVLIDRASGAATRWRACPSECWRPRWSPRGDRIAYSEQTRTGSWPVVWAPLGRAEERHMPLPSTPSGPAFVAPAWAPDGAGLIVALKTAGGTRLVRAALDGHLESVLSDLGSAEVGTVGWAP